MGETKRKSGWSSSPLSLQRLAGSWIDLVPAENGTSGLGSLFPSRYRGDGVLISISAIMAMMVATGWNNGMDRWPSISSTNKEQPSSLLFLHYHHHPRYRSHGSFPAELPQTLPTPAIGKGTHSIVLTVQNANRRDHFLREKASRLTLKSVEIIRLLLEKYPDGVPELYVFIVGIHRTSTNLIPLQDLTNHRRRSAPPVLPPRLSSHPGGVNENPRPSQEPVSVKTEETHPNVHAEPPLDEPDGPRKGRDVRSMAPPPVTPTPHSPPPPFANEQATSHDATDRLCRPDGGPEGEAGDAVDVHDAVRHQKLPQRRPRLWWQHLTRRTRCCVASPISSMRPPLTRRNRRRSSTAPRR
jgi:hypothetical protein